MVSVMVLQYGPVTEINLLWGEIHNTMWGGEGGSLCVDLVFVVKIGLLGLHSTEAHANNVVTQENLD